MKIPTKDADVDDATLPRYRWVVLFACWASFTLTAVDRSTWGPASVFVGDSLSVPIASLGAFATAYYVGYVISNACGGFMSDALGGRITLAVSLFGAGALMFTFGYTTSAAVGIAVQAAVGLFAGADYSAGIKLITSWFHPSEFGLVMGIFLTATSLGLAIANSVVPFLIEHHSWHTSYHLFGIISMIFAVVLYFLVRPGPLRRVNTESDSGIVKPKATLLLRNRNFVLACAGGFGAFWAVYGFITWANALMIKGHGVPATTAGMVIVVFSIAAVASKPVIGLVADRFFPTSRKVPIMITLGVFGVVLSVFGGLSSVTAFFWMAPILGLIAYGGSTLLVAMVPTLVPNSLTGTAAGLSNSIWQLGSAAVPIVIGAVFGATGSFQAAFLTLAAGPILGLLIVAAIREPRLQPKGGAEAEHNDDIGNTDVSIPAADPHRSGTAQ